MLCSLCEDHAFAESWSADAPESTGPTLLDPLANPAWRLCDCMLFELGVGFQTSPSFLHVLHWHARQQQPTSEMHHQRIHRTCCPPSCNWNERTHARCTHAHMNKARTHEHTACQPPTRPPSIRKSRTTAANPRFRQTTTLPLPSQPASLAPIAPVSRNGS